MIILVFIIFYFFLVGEEDGFGSYRISGLPILLIPFVWLMYFPVCESLMGQTLGKKAFNLHVVSMTGDTDGKPPSLVQAFIRRAFDMFEIVFFGIPSLLAINHSDGNQRIGDMLAGTTVVRTDAVCRHCGTQLELTPGEVIRKTFTCPACRENN